MMAITPTFLDGRLDIVGDAANDTVVISTVNVGGVPHVTVNGLAIGPGVPAAAVTSIVADLGAGNDIMNLSTLNTATFSGLTNGSVTLSGGVGNDNLTGTSLADTLIGGDNNDILVGGAGDDTIDAGNANDTLDGGAGDDLLTGGNGIDSYRHTGSGQLGSDTLVESPTDNFDDTLHFAGLGGSVTVDLSLTTPQEIRPGLLTITLSSGTSFERIEGTGFADMLYGNSRNNYINGANGNDLVWGRDGADNLLGGAGDDSIYGEGGNDTINGLQGNDSLYGGDGDDDLTGHTGADYLAGGTSADTYTFTTSSAGGLDTIDEAPGSGEDRFNVAGLPLTNFPTFDSTAVQALTSLQSIQFLTAGAVEWFLGGGVNPQSNTPSYSGGYFTVPGQVGTTTTLEFKYGGANAGYNNTSYVYDASPAPTLATTYLFTGNVTAVGATKVLQVKAGTKLGFFIEQNGSASDRFDADDSLNLYDIALNERNHAHAFSPRPGEVQLRWEDLYYERPNPRGYKIDFDYNDLFMSVAAAALNVPVPEVTVSVSPPAVEEDSGDGMVFTFTRSAPIDEPLTVRYSVGGSATAGVDYTGLAAGGSIREVMIPAGQSTYSMAVFPTAEDDIELDETVEFTILPGHTYDIGFPGSASGTIKDDDRVVVTIESARGSGLSVGAVREGDSGVAGFTLKRSLAKNEALSVAIAVDVSSPAAQGVASLHDDYILQDDEGNEYDVTNGIFVVTWAASDDSFEKTIYLAARIDNSVEGDETVTATLPVSVAPDTYTVGAPSSADATIEDDPPVVTVSRIQNGSEDPDADGTSTSPKSVKFLLTRTGGDITSPVTVTFTVMGTGTHAADINDYVNENSAAVYESATVELAVVDDDEVEFREELTLDLDDSSSDFTVGEDGEAVATISDNDFMITGLTVAFDDQGVKRDSTGVKYDPKQWDDTDGDGESDVHGENVSTPTHGYPISFPRSIPGALTMMAAFASVKIAYKDSNVLEGTFKISGDSDYPNGVSLFSGTTAIGAPVAEADGSIVVTVTGTTTCDTDLPGTIDYADLRVTWTLEREVVVDGDSATQSALAGTSLNLLYVTGAVAADAYETVLDLGCRGAAGKRPGNAGELAEDLNANGVLDAGEDTNGNGALDDDAGIANRDVADAIFGMFSRQDAGGGLETKRVDGTVMVYVPNANGWTASTPLSDPNGHGQCGAWADLLHQTFAAQGIVSTKRQVTFGDPNVFKFKVAAGNVQGGVRLANPRTEFAYHVVVRIASNPNRIYDAAFALTTDKRAAASVERQWEDDHVIDLMTNPFGLVPWFGSNPEDHQLTWGDWPY